VAELPSLPALPPSDTKVRLGLGDGASSLIERPGVRDESGEFDVAERPIVSVELDECEAESTEGAMV
jgi:hypothetical protein